MKIVSLSSGEVRVINAKTGKSEYSNSCRLSDADIDSDNADAYVTQAVYSSDINGIVLTTYDQNIVLLSKDFTSEKQVCETRGRKSETWGRKSETWGRKSETWGRKS